MTAVLVGIVGLLGVVVGGILQIDASRRALLRESQLEAATQMHVAATAFFTEMERRARAMGLDDVRHLTPEQRLAWLDASKDTADAAREDARGLMDVLARVVLVFGHSSKTGAAAAESVGQVHAIVAILADQGRPRVDEFNAAWEAAVMSLERFSRAAHDEFTRPVWRPW